jgi:hypothetical protein
VFTARYALSPFIKQIRFVFKGLIVLLPERERGEAWELSHKEVLFRRSRSPGQKVAITLYKFINETNYYTSLV